MAFTPRYNSDYIFSNELCEFPSPVPGGDPGGLAMCCEETLPFLDYGVYNMVQPEYDFRSTVSMSSLPERLGVSDMTVPTVPESNIGLCRIAGTQGFGGEECCGFGSNFWSGYPVATNTWEIQGQPVQEIEEPTMKIGRYSVEERKDKILRYLKKRNQRNFNKTIKYACRKTLADKRVRVRGRFAKNNERCEDEGAMKNNTTHEETELFYGDDFQIKHDEEDWLQEAMASLMYLPYIAGDLIDGAIVK